MTGELPAVDRDPEAGIYRLEIGPDDAGPAVGVVRLLQEIEEVEGIDVPPLYDVLDYDALDRLVSGQRRKPRAVGLTVECVTEQFRLTVECSGGRTVAEARLDGDGEG